MKNLPLRIFKSWIPVILWAGLIFYFSSIPNLKTNLENDFILRKIAHVIEYFILTFLMYRAFNDLWDMRFFPFTIYPAVLSFLYAVSDEYHQSFIPGRSACIRDVLVDAAGIFCFYIMMKVFLKK